jgi:hypothetical protein
MVDITDAIFLFVSGVLNDTFGRLREAKLKYYVSNKRPLGRKFNICSPSPWKKWMKTSPTSRHNQARAKQHADSP